MDYEKRVTRVFPLFFPQLIYLAYLTEVCLLPKAPSTDSVEGTLSSYHEGGTHPQEPIIWVFSGNQAVPV